MTTDVIRYEDTAENRADLFDFYRDVYPDSPWLLDHDRFIWQNLSNPLREEASSQIWLLYDMHDRIIGQNILIPYNLLIDKRLYRGYCSTNLVLRPELVGQGLGHKLIEKNESLRGVAYAVGITPASARAFGKRGWRHVEDACLLSIFINPIPNLRYLKMPSWKIALVVPLLIFANALSNIVRWIAVPRTLEGVSCREIAHFEPEMDQLWEEFLADHGIHFQRDSVQLNYKYCSRKDVKHTILLFEEYRRPVGYGVFRLSENKVRNVRMGRIVDLVYDPALGAKLAKHMIHVMIRKLAGCGVDSIVGIVSCDELKKAYRLNGLYLSRVQPAIIKEDGFLVSELRKAYKNLWYITLGDSDLDNYW